MTEPQKSLEQRIAECRSTQEIADLQAERSGLAQHIEGGARVLSLPTMDPGRILIRSTPELAGTRDGRVNIPAEQLTRALEIDPNLKILAMGTTNSELENRLAQCHDSAELAELMVQGRLGKL